jgi:hypothetical protein
LDDERDQQDDDDAYDSVENGRERRVIRWGELVLRFGCHHREAFIQRRGRDLILHRWEPVFQIINDGIRVFRGKR